MSDRKSYGLFSGLGFTDHSLVKEPPNLIRAAVVRRGHSNLNPGRTAGAGAETQRPVAGERGQLPEHWFRMRRFHKQAELGETGLTGRLLPQQPPLEIDDSGWPDFMRHRKLIRGQKREELVQLAQAPTLPPSHCRQNDVPEV